MGHNKRVGIYSKLEDKVYLLQWMQGHSSGALECLTDDNMFRYKPVLATARAALFRCAGLLKRYLAPAFSKSIDCVDSYSSVCQCSIVIDVIYTNLAPAKYALFTKLQKFFPGEKFQQVFSSSTPKFYFLN
jgi:hypothetical protein